jgi:hypothetical protein
MSGQSTPTEAAQDPSNRSLFDSELSGNRSLRSTCGRKRPYIAHLGGGQFGSPASLAPSTRRSPLLVPVGNVFKLSAKPHMGRVHARRVVARVAHTEARRDDLTVRQRPSETMGVPSMSLECKRAVPVGVCVPSPDPAVAGRPVGLFPEVVGCTLSHSRVEPPPRFRGQERSSIPVLLRSARHFTT